MKHIIDIIAELRNQIAIFNRELKEGRLRIPVFQDDACRWLIQIQQHFDMKKEGKLQLVVKVLEGHAYDWYKQWGVSNPKVSWEELQMSVLKKFQARYDLNLPVRVQEREGKSWEQDKRENEGLKIKNQNCSKGGTVGKKMLC